MRGYVLIMVRGIISRREGVKIMILNACVKFGKMVDENKCKECMLTCRHAGEPTTKEKLDKSTYGTAEYWNNEKDNAL